ncbi:FadR/GntR family transcriptional regulator [Brachybacterium saurashtrense]|uniref:FadR family transcriptional regulator n=1 Tax=Brachybacterium saurashtrense TaxID=556288 RepID=A0A345YRW3_9MICO|nr:FCD domain-containing protein [Brachybacterium saurashtrense]AXK46665.1 FadR family transcriptional regulator [Brachybacterium saurashtrense]RRR22379.1 FadR family transcriptional regulator [Brachybacterium saurashtrense]
MDAETLEFLDSLVREGTAVEEGILIPTERRLAEASGMSRARVRERLSGLQMLGMLKKVQGSGNILVTPSFDGGSGNVFELMLRAGMVTGSQLAEAREMLEVAIAPRMVERVTEEQIRELEDLVHEMIDASSDRDFVRGLRADHAFHLALFAVLGNPIMNYVAGGMNHALHDLLLERRRVVISKEIAANGGAIPEMFASDEVHFEITRALRTRRREAVAAAMAEHFDRWRRISRTPSRGGADRPAPGAAPQTAQAPDETPPPT